MNLFRILPRIQYVKILVVRFVVPHRLNWAEAQLYQIVVIVMEPTSTRNPRPSPLAPELVILPHSSAAAAPGCFGLRPPPAPGQPTVAKSIPVSPRIHPMEQGQPAATPLRVFGPSSGARARRMTLPPPRPRTGDATPAPHCCSLRRPPQAGVPPTYSSISYAAADAAVCTTVSLTPSLLAELRACQDTGVCQGFMVKSMYLSSTSAPVHHQWSTEADGVVYPPMDPTNPNDSGKTQQGNGTTAAESIFGSMTRKTPMQCRRMVDKFAQSFLQRRKEKAELKSLAELQAVEASLYTHKQNSEPEGHMSSNITRENTQKCKDFGLNEVLKFEDEDNEGYADSNIPEMHADGASFAGENACPADNADYSNGNEHGNREEDKYEEIIESVMNPEEQTAEQIEMDRMFANKKYPTMQEISEASTPTVGMEFDSKEDAFFFFAVYARRHARQPPSATAGRRSTSAAAGRLLPIAAERRRGEAVDECRRGEAAANRRRGETVDECRRGEAAAKRRPGRRPTSTAAGSRPRENCHGENASGRLERGGGCRRFNGGGGTPVRLHRAWGTIVKPTMQRRWGRTEGVVINQYGMPFAPIIGVDNYGKTVVFGVGLLEDERADTFKWLFEEFLSAMDNKHPETIITDQDVAMRIGISKALPYTVHRFCNFHISKNLDDKLSLFFAVRGTLKEELRAVIRNSFTPEEFETEWHDLLQRHNALGEPHLDRIYDIRAQWVPTYFKESFFPFTSSTGRSESTNSLFKHYVKRKDSIETFFKEYMIIQEKKQSDLDRLREKNEFKESVNWGFNPLEREAMKIYTYPIYGKFAEELMKGTSYNVEVVEEMRLYRVIRLTNYRNAEFPDQHIWLVFPLMRMYTNARAQRWLVMEYNAAMS
ncbi:hypothetical protein QYE76_032237 [Lolium multiflorum]|uniref:Protein FAR1-RELATED SEQUENCE n=1 Tax=Lolium multiflorum TaxID=4521 RepID=A0AAD8QWG0_LOLMU|nr:hypothetical protein QYE76_032237 [Lolium multiflorum]